VLHILRPAKAPGFAYAWLELVSHRIFVGRVLAMTPQQRVSIVSDLSRLYMASGLFWLNQSRLARDESTSEQFLISTQC